MSDDYEQDATGQSNIALLSHQRILWTMAFVVILGSIAGFVFVSRQFGFGVVIGGTLSFINYLWLKLSLRKVFDNAADGTRPGFLAVRYFARYAALAGVLGIVFLLKVIPVVAVIAGLSSFAVAIVIEGFLRLFSSLFKN